MSHSDPSAEIDLQHRLDVLAHRPGLLVVLDFDGVLAPIVAHPDLSRPTPEAVAGVRRLLDAGVPVAVVSGRSLASLTQVSGLDRRVLLVGGHGGQWAQGAGLPPAPPEQAPDPIRYAAVRDLLERVAAAHCGAWVEAKPASVALHVRRAEPAAAAAALAQARAGLEEIGGLRLLPGKAVLEALLTTADKGQAVTRLREVLGAGAVLYVGDDVTDEAAFAVLRDGDLGVKVGPGPTVATARVPDPGAVADLLDRLVSLRAATPQTPQTPHPPARAREG